MTLSKLRSGFLLYFIGSAIWLLSGCSYSFTGASISPDVKTISVDFFKSRADLAPPILEQSFTEALKDIFISQTSLRLINDGGDLQFEGNITGYTYGPVAVSANQVTNKERLTITVRVKFTNTKDPKRSFERSFTRFQDYDASRSITQVENELINDINQQLVQNIFDESVSNW